MSRTWQRWLPAAVVSVLIAAGALAGPLTAGAAVDLPDKTPAQVLAMIGESNVRALSGTLEQTSHLGLPELPTSGSSAGAASALELLTGSHTARVYLDGATNVRIQVLDRLAERDVVRHGNDVWLYNSKDNTATHVTLPDVSMPRDAREPGDVQTPEQLAHRFLTMIDPGTKVTVTRDAEVAGRSAYDLVLTPRSTHTLVGSVSIAVDSETGLPLRVDVQARGQKEPAFRLAFTALTLQKPDAGLFKFSPPPGAKVTEQKLPSLDSMREKMNSMREKMREKLGDAGSHSDHCKHSDHSKHGDHSKLRPTVVGSGWDAVIELPADAVPSEMTSSKIFAQVTSAVDGGRLLSTALVNVLLTDDGRLFAGSVPLERLQTAAAGQ